MICCIVGLDTESPSSFPLIYPPANCVCGVILFSRCPSVTLCSLRWTSYKHCSLTLFVYSALFFPLLSMHILPLWVSKAYFILSSVTAKWYIFQTYITNNESQAVYLYQILKYPLKYINLNGKYMFNLIFLYN